MLYALENLLFALWEFILCLIPRFHEDTIALQINEDGDYEMICSAETLETEELASEFDAVTVCNVFSWFGLSFPYGFDGTIYTWTRKA